MEAFTSSLNDIGAAILQWVNPTLTDAERVTSSWPLTSFSSAIIVSMLYLVCIFVGTLVMKAIYGGQESATIKSKSVVEKFTKEPVLFFVAVYNLTQVLLCGYMIWRAVEGYIALQYVPICNAFNKHETAMASVLWIFYVSKVLDFCDTIFIVLRRKWKQLIFLHLYHHTSIFLIYWLNINAGYDGDIYYTIILNSFIHLVMYSYYEATTFNITVPKFLKKIVTNLQRIQFVTMMAQAALMLAMQCDYPSRITWLYLFYIISLFYLFTQFSNREYGTSAPGKGKKSDD
jgi:elongation of very long chain fatty acids protein 4